MKQHTITLSAGECDSRHEALGHLCQRWSSWHDRVQ